LTFRVEYTANSQSFDSLKNNIGSMVKTILGSIVFCLHRKSANIPLTYLKLDEGDAQRLKRAINIATGNLKTPPS